MAKTVHKMYKLDRSNYNKISVNVKNVLPEGGSGGGSGGAPGGATVVNNAPPPQMVQQAMAQGPTDNPLPLPPKYVGSDGSSYDPSVDSPSDYSIQSYDPSTPEPTPLKIHIPSPTDNTFPAQFPFTPAQSDSMSFAPSSALPTPQPAGIGRLPSPPPQVVASDTPGGIASMEVDKLVHSAPGMSEREIRNDLAQIIAPFANMLQQIELARSTEAAQAARERAQMFERVVSAHAEQNARVGKAMEQMMRSVHGTFTNMPPLAPQAPTLPLPMPISTPMVQTRDSLFNFGTLPPEAPVQSYSWGPLAPSPKPRIATPRPKASNLFNFGTLPAVTPLRKQGPYNWGQVSIDPLDVVPVPSMRRDEGFREMKQGQPSPRAATSEPKSPVAESKEVKEETAIESQETPEMEEESQEATEATPVPLSLDVTAMVPFAGPVTPKLQLDPALEAIRNAILNRTQAPPLQFVSDDDPLAKLIERTNNANTFAIVRKEGKEAPKVPMGKLIKRLETVIRAAESSGDQKALVKALGYVDGLNRGLLTPEQVQKDTNKMFAHLRTVTRRDAAKSHATQEVLRKKRAAKGADIRAKRVSEILKERRARDNDL